jgi:hypothetical protein
MMKVLFIRSLFPSTIYFLFLLLYLFYQLYLIIMTNVELTTKYNLSKIDKKLIKIDF